MALYKYANYLTRSEHQAFDTLHKPGAGTPSSGVYRCEGCTKEVASNAGNPLPPEIITGAIQFKV